MLIGCRVLTQPRVKFVQICVGDATATKEDILSFRYSEGNAIRERRKL